MTKCEQGFFLKTIDVKKNSEYTYFYQNFIIFIFSKMKKHIEWKNNQGEKREEVISRRLILCNKTEETYLVTMTRWTGRFPAHVETEPWLFELISNSILIFYTDCRSYLCIRVYGFWAMALKNYYSWLFIKCFGLFNELEIIEDYSDTVTDIHDIFCCKSCCCDGKLQNEGNSNTRECKWKLNK